MEEKKGRKWVLVCGEDNEVDRVIEEVIGFIREEGLDGRGMGGRGNVIEYFDLE